MKKSTHTQTPQQIIPVAFSDCLVVRYFRYNPVTHIPPLSLKERTPIIMQLCLRSGIGLREKYCYTLFNIAHCFSSDVSFTDIVVQSMRQFGATMKSGVPTVRGQCLFHLILTTKVCLGNILMSSLQAKMTSL